MCCVCGVYDLCLNIYLFTFTYECIYLINVSCMHKCMNDFNLFVLLDYIGIPD